MKRTWVLYALSRDSRRRAIVWSGSAVGVVMPEGGAVEEGSLKDSFSFSEVREVGMSMPVVIEGLDFVAS